LAVRSHPPYSPNLALSDLRLFEALKKAIRGKRFGTDDEVIKKGNKCLRIQNSDKKGMADIRVSLCRKAVLL
jgi:hypothetical protein